MNENICGDHKFVPCPDEGCQSCRDARWTPDGVRDFCHKRFGELQDVVCGGTLTTHLS